MECTAHPDTLAIDTCSRCGRALCDACATHEIDGIPCCERCGHAEDDQNRAWGAGLLALVAVGYLASIAIGIVIFKPRPFVGGLAAIVAIALGRALQLVVKMPVVSRRTRAD